MADIAGLLNVNKPLHVTSHDVVGQVRRVAQTRRVGHGGTLDPLASGVLVVAIGRATRLLEYVVGQPKTYEALVRLGQTSTTYDAEGELSAVQPANYSLAEIEETLDHFRGPIDQIPPMYSAVKRGGKPLYELARRGVEVEREPRRVTIYELALLQWSPPQLHLRVTSSAGTYVRSLAHDLGQLLGSGAYLAGLERTAVGSFTSDQAVPLAALTPENLPNHLLPAETAASHLPRLELDEEAARRLLLGQQLEREPQDPEAALVRAYDAAGTFLGIAGAAGPLWRPRKIFN